MLFVFNNEKLRLLLKDFHTVTNIHISIFSDQFKEMMAYPESMSQFCSLIRTDPKALERCMQCDKEACINAAKQGSSYVYKCHSGLTEAIVPVLLDNIIIAYLFFGQIFCYPSHRDGWNVIKKCCASYDIDMELLKNISFKMPVVQEQYIISASHLLNAIPLYLGMERMVMIKKQELSVQIDNYINSYLEKPVGVKDICAHFKIGKTHLYEISRKIYGSGIAGHIRNLRVEKAKSLLMDNPEMNIKEIHSLCGFNDYDYFFTTFKNITGMSPMQFRNSENTKYKVSMKKKDDYS